MSFRRLMQGIMVVCALLILVTGCSRPIVRQQAQGPPGMPGPVPGGPVAEQDLQTLQANLKPVYFDYDQYTLSAEAQSALQYDSEIMKRAVHGKIVAEGHCDERGTAEYNLALGDRRARAVADYLVSLGVPPQSLSTVSYGSELPVDPGHNEAAWAKNRRVYLRVSK
jgi:peptidoglycan-associated lipoprotein